MCIYVVEGDSKLASEKYYMSDGVECYEKEYIRDTG